MMPRPFKLWYRTKDKVSNPKSLEVDPDASKLTNSSPLRFRISYGVKVNVGIDTFFKSRKEIEELELETLSTLLEDKQINSDEALKNAIMRVEKGQANLIATVRSVKHLTHPDVMMLADMRENPNQYVNERSVFSSIFNALAKKVMDLSFCALADVNNAQARTSLVRGFKTAVGGVTRGMDQFEYDMPNPSEANQYVNFSVIPAAEQYSQLRFPTYFNNATGQKEKIPKTRFLDVYQYYLNELFNCYRRYLKTFKQDQTYFDTIRTGSNGSDSDSDDEPQIKETLISPGKVGVSESSSSSSSDPLQGSLFIQEDLDDFTIPKEPSVENPGSTPPPPESPIKVTDPPPLPTDAAELLALESKFADAYQLLESGGFLGKKYHEANTKLSALLGDEKSRKYQAIEYFRRSGRMYPIPEIEKKKQKSNPTEGEE